MKKIMIKKIISILVCSFPILLFSQGDSTLIELTATLDSLIQEARDIKAAASPEDSIGFDYWIKVVLPMIAAFLTTLGARISRWKVKFNIFADLLKERDTMSIVTTLAVIFGTIAVYIETQDLIGNIPLIGSYSFLAYGGSIIIYETLKGIIGKTPKKVESIEKTNTISIEL